MTVLLVLFIVLLIVGIVGHFLYQAFKDGVKKWLGGVKQLQQNVVKKKHQQKKKGKKERGKGKI